MNQSFTQPLPRLFGVALMLVGVLLIWVGPKLTRSAERQSDQFPTAVRVWATLVASLKERQLYLQWLGVFLPILGILAIILGVIQLFQ